MPPGKMADTIVIDGGLGETRTAVLGPAGLVELVYDRPFEAVRDGDIFLARVGKPSAGGEGLFLTLGSGLEAFLPLRRAKSRPNEGELISVRVRVTARAGKRIVARREDPPAGGGASGGQPGLIHRAPDRWLEPVLERKTDEIEAIVITDPDLFIRARERLPELAGQIRLDRDDPPAFERLGIEDEIERLFAPRLTLAGGGALSIEHTAAGTAIDIDTGTATGNDAEAVARTVNVEAAREIARLLRLCRNGGLVFIDFVGMRAARSRKAVLAALDQALASDPVQTERTGFSRFGVVELNRERRGTPLLDEIGARATALHPNPATCGGAILRALERESRSAPGQVLVVSCDQPTERWLKETDIDGRHAIERARQSLHARIIVRADLEPGRWSVYSQPRS